MSREEICLLEGTNQLLAAGVETAARQLLDIQVGITRTSYAAVRCAVRPQRVVSSIEAAQVTITRGAYGAVVVGSRIAGTLAATLLAIAAQHTAE